MPDLQQLPDSYRRCRLLVDGYNLMYAIGAIQHGDTRPNALQLGRDRLLSQLSEGLPLEQRRLVWVVFDSEVAPKDLPDHWTRQGMQIAFSRGWISADEMLQAIIAAHHSPKQLVVLSSDHAVQRRAIARGAMAFDSEHWERAVASMVDASASSRVKSPIQDQELRPEHVSEEDRKDWLRRFGFEDGV